MKKLLITIIIIVIVVIGGLWIWNKILEKKPPEPGTVLDEAKAAGRDAASLAGADEDYYADMDYGVTKNPETVRAALDLLRSGHHRRKRPSKSAVRGRNNWIVWTAGNDRLWDVLSRNSAGIPRSV